MQISRTEYSPSREIKKHAAELKVLINYSIKDAIKELYFGTKNNLKRVFFCTINRDLAHKYRLNSPILVSEITEITKQLIDTKRWHIFDRYMMTKSLRKNVISLFEILSKFSTATSRIDYFLETTKEETSKFLWPFE